MSSDHVFDDGVVHFTGEGDAGAGGSVVGARTLCVRDKIALSILGGIMKCMVSSLYVKECQNIEGSDRE